jgi:hypothetical protein
MLVSKFGSKFGGKREVASKRLNIDDAILSKLGHLSSQNDPREGRRAKGPTAPFAEEEKTWLREAVRILTQRAIEIDSACAGLPLLTMDDLPQL